MAKPRTELEQRQNLVCDKTRRGGATYSAAVSQLGFSSAIARDHWWRFAIMPTVF